MNKTDYEKMEETANAMQQSSLIEMGEKSKMLSHIIKDTTKE